MKVKLTEIYKPDMIVYDVSLNKHGSLICVWGNKISVKFYKSRVRYEVKNSDLFINETLKIVK